MDSKFSLYVYVYTFAGLINIMFLQVFGGGTKPLLDANVQKIVDAGFSEEQAESTLKYTKNNVDRALRILQKRDNSENRSKDKPKDQDQPSQPKRKGRNKDNDEDGLPVKPSGKVSLFDFLEDKLPNVPDKDKNNRRDNNTPSEDRGERSYGNKDRNSAKNQPRSQGSRYEGPRHRSERGQYDNYHNSHREDRKYQAQNEKPPRFQRKLDEKNKQQQQANNVNLHYNNAYHGQSHNQYPEINTRIDQFNDTSMNQQQNYRNINPMDSLVDATANLNLLSNQTRPNEEVSPGRNYQSYAEQAYPPKQYVPNQQMQEIPPFRRNNDMPKYQDQAYQRRQQQPQPNGYMEPQQAPMYSNMNYMGAAQVCLFTRIIDIYLTIGSAISSIKDA